MPQPMVAAHKAYNCLYELVDCPFSSVGCNERVLRKDNESHEEAAMKQHNRLLLQDNRSLRQGMQSLRQDNRSLQQKVNTQLYQIVYKVKLADLVRDGEINIFSDDLMVRTYRTYMSVQKEYIDNEYHCDVYLYVEEGPFPCRASYTVEVVHWDGKSESACKKEIDIVYDEASGWGRPKFIRLSKLTDVGSPYVKDGHVTFICTFRFLPLE